MHGGGSKTPDRHMGLRTPFFEKTLKSSFRTWTIGSHKSPFSKEPQMPSVQRIWLLLFLKEVQNSQLINSDFLAFRPWVQNLLIISNARSKTYFFVPLIQFILHIFQTQLWNISIIPIACLARLDFMLISDCFFHTRKICIEANHS